MIIVNLINRVEIGTDYAVHIDLNIDLEHFNIQLDMCSYGQRETAWNLRFKPLDGGDEGDRTPYLLNAIQALSQVSYAPVFNFCTYPMLS